MSATAHSLYQALEALLQHAQVPDASCVRACHPHAVQALHIRQPTLSLVVHGQMQLHGADVDATACRGQALFINRACHLDVHHTPDAGAQQPFRSLTITLCEDVLQAARLLWSRPVAPSGQTVVVLPLQAIGELVLQWMHSLLRADAVQARLALAGMLIHLAEQGHTHALRPARPDASAQILEAIEQQPQRLWRSVDFEDMLQVSGATLRRRLAAEQTSLRELLTQARLAAALKLLYTTDWPLKTIAAKVGYQSAAAFSQQFTQRYGLQPAAIGNAREDRTAA